MELQTTKLVVDSKSFAVRCNYHKQANNNIIKGIISKMVMQPPVELHSQEIVGYTISSTFLTLRGIIEYK